MNTARSLLILLATTAAAVALSQISVGSTATSSDIRRAQSIRFTPDFRVTFRGEALKGDSGFWTITALQPPGISHESLTWRQSPRKFAPLPFRKEAGR